MSQFSKLYSFIQKELLSEQEQQKNEEQSIEIPPDVDVSPDDQTQEIDTNQPSALENEELAGIKVDWIKKIISLLTLLDRENQNVKDIISRLSSTPVDGESIKSKESQIEELLRTIPIEKNP